jgi:glucose-6-phosphate isomerase
MTSLKTLPAWTALKNHYETIRSVQMRDWFAADRAARLTRAQRFTFEGGGLVVDCAKNRITDETLQLLVQPA